MKQKPVFLKHLTYIVSMASLLFPTANLLHLNSILFSNEGNHPKNVNLAEPLGINCPISKIDTIKTGVYPASLFNYTKI
jgi:hypothetical protein